MSTSTTTGSMSHFTKLFHHIESQPPPHSIGDISSKLTALGINKDDVKLLSKQEVDGECLQYLTDESLNLAGVPTLGRRVKILRAAHTILSEWAAGMVQGASTGTSIIVSKEGRSPAVAPATPPTPQPRTIQGSKQVTASAAEKDKEKEKEKDKPSSSSAAAKGKEADKSSTSKPKPKSRDDDSGNESDDEPLSRTNKLKQDKEKEKEKEKSNLKDPKSKERPQIADKDKKPSNATLSSTGSHTSTSISHSDDEHEADEAAEASEAESDTEIEREFKHPRAIAAEKEAAAKKAAAAKSGGDEDDDLFGTSEGTHAAEFMAVKPWLGAIVAPSKAPKADPSPPEQHLKLEWVHGYRSFDSRSNLVYNEANDIIYPVAAVVVVYNSKQKKQKHFLGHNDDIRCLAQHPTKANLIVSGQNSTIIKGKGTPCYICVWDSTDFTKNTVLKMTKEDRAVRAVCFSGEGKYVASVSNDDNHTIKLWDWEKKTLLTTAKGDNNPIYAIKSNHKNPNEFVTVGKRHAVFWTYENGKLTGKKASIPNQAQLSFFAAAYSEKGYACLGAEDGGIYVFVDGKPAKVFPNIHQGKVLSIDYYQGGIISGGADNIVNLLDKKMESHKKLKMEDKVTSVHIKDNNVLVGTMGAEVYEVKNFADIEHDNIVDTEIEPVTRGHSDGELWAVAVSSNNKLFVTVGEDNMVGVWDIQAHKLIKQGRINDKKGKAPKILKASTTSTHPTNQCARAIAISPNNKQLIIGQNNGEVSVYDLKTLSKVTSVDLNKFGKRNVKDQVGNWIQVIQYSPDGHIAAVGTHGSVVVLLDVNDGYKPKGVCKSSNSFISHLDWSNDGTTIQTNDGAYELLFYSVDPEDCTQVSQITHASSTRDTQWASITCTLGWGVQGVYSGDQNGQEVNSVDVTQDRRLAVTGDDTGCVNLYRYPVLKGGKSFSAHCHSSHVCTVRFTSDEKYVISTGGHDLAIMQWSVV